MRSMNLKKYLYELNLGNPFPACSFSSFISANNPKEHDCQGAVVRVAVEEKNTRFFVRHKTRKFLTRRRLCCLFIRWRRRLWVPAFQHCAATKDFPSSCTAVPIHCTPPRSFSSSANLRYSCRSFCTEQQYQEQQQQHQSDNSNAIFLSLRCCCIFAYLFALNWNVTNI